MFFALGYFDGTRIVHFVPSCVLSGFLAVVGWKIMLKAVDAATGEHLSFDLSDLQVEPLSDPEFWEKLLPAIPIGVGLYFAKKHHVLPPTILLPVVLGVPLILFYVALFAKNPSGGGVTDDMANARTDGWFYKEFGESDFESEFWNGFELLYGGDGFMGHVKWGSIISVTSDLFIMMLIIAIDALLKLAGTKKKLEFFELDFNHEMKLQGVNNLAMGLLVGAPGYSQLKFNLLNYGITNTKQSRVPGYICAAICMGLYFSGFMAINYMPRFWLGALIIYAGLGFLDENLVGITKHMSWMEIAAVYIILIIGAVNTLQVAIAVGLIMALIIFIFDYSGRGVIDWEKSVPGKNYNSYVERGFRETLRLRHLGELWCVISLKRFLFFASVAEIQDVVQDLIDRVSGNFGDEHDGGSDDKTQKNYNPHRRFLDKKGKYHNPLLTCRPFTFKGYHYIIMDFTQVDGIDYTGASKFVELLKMCKAADIQVIFTGLQPMGDWNTISKKIAHDSENIGLKQKWDMYKLLMREGVLPQCSLRKSDEQIPGKQASQKKKESGTSLLDVDAVYPTVGMAVEVIEEKLLGRAAAVRRKWLMFTSAKKIHFRYVQKTSHEAFEEIFSGEMGIDIGDYITQRVLQTDEVLAYAGQELTSLFLVQTGRLGAWITRLHASSEGDWGGPVEQETPSDEMSPMILQAQANRRIAQQGKAMRTRVGTYTRGVIINDEVLVESMYSPHEIRADRRTVIIEISAAALAHMEITKPHMFQQLLRKTLYHESQLRHLLEAEKELSEHKADYYLENIKKMRTKRLNKLFQKTFQNPFSTLNRTLDQRLKNIDKEFEKKHIQKSSKQDEAYKKKHRGTVAAMAEAESLLSHFVKGDQVQIVKPGSSKNGNLCIVIGHMPDVGRVKVLMGLETKSYMAAELKVVKRGFMTDFSGAALSKDFINGDRVKIVKVGSSKFGNLCVVTGSMIMDNGGVRIKVIYESNLSTKSYLPNELALVSKGPDFSHIKKVHYRLPKHMKIACAACFDAQVVEFYRSQHLLLDAGCRSSKASKFMKRAEASVKKKMSESVDAKLLLIAASAKKKMRAEAEAAAIKADVSDPSNMLSDESAADSKEVESTKEMEANSDLTAGGDSAPLISLSVNMPIPDYLPATVESFNNAIVRLGIYPVRCELKRAIMKVAGGYGHKRKIYKKGFCAMVESLVLKEFSKEEVVRYKIVFDQFNKGKALSEQQLISLLEEGADPTDTNAEQQMGHFERKAIVGKLVERWDSHEDPSASSASRHGNGVARPDGKIEFDEFMSMLAYHLGIFDTDRLLEELKDTYLKFVEPEQAYRKDEASDLEKRSFPKQISLGKSLAMQRKAAAPASSSPSALSSPSSSSPASKSQTLPISDQIEVVPSPVTNDNNDSSAAIIDVARSATSDVMIDIDRSFTHLALHAVSRERAPDYDELWGLEKTRLGFKERNDGQEHKEELAYEKEHKDDDSVKRKIQRKLSFRDGAPPKDETSSRHQHLTLMGSKGTRPRRSLAYKRGMTRDELLGVELTEKRIFETLWYFDAIMYGVALKWSISGMRWVERWIDLNSRLLRWHDYTFAHSDIQVDLQDVSIFWGLEAAEAAGVHVSIDACNESIPERFTHLVEDEHGDLKPEYSVDNLVIVAEGMTAKSAFLLKSNRVKEWREALTSSTHHGRRTKKETRNLMYLARDMLWEADEGHTHGVDFKRNFLNTITLVHEDEMEAVLADETTKLMQEKISYVDPWHQNSSLSDKQMSLREAARTGSLGQFNSKAKKAGQRLTSLFQAT